MLHIKVAFASLCEGQTGVLGWTA